MLITEHKSSSFHLIINQFNPGHVCTACFLKISSSVDVRFQVLTVASVKITPTALWYTAPCRCVTYRPDDGDSMNF
jgi:hypothetical protein